MGMIVSAYPVRPEYRRKDIIREEDIENFTGYLQMKFPGQLRWRGISIRAEQRTRVLLEFNESARLINATNNINEIIQLVCKCARMTLSARKAKVWYGWWGETVCSPDKHHSLETAECQLPQKAVHDGICQVGYG